MNEAIVIASVAVSAISIVVAVHTKIKFNNLRKEFDDFVENLLDTLKEQ